MFKHGFKFGLGWLNADCLLCGTGVPLKQGLCIACEQDIVENQHGCKYCALPLASDTQLDSHGDICGRCLYTLPWFISTYAPFVYAPPIDHMIQQLKFNAALKYSPCLSELFLKHFRQQKILLPDLLLSVPLHRQRLHERGFNQSQQMARHIAKKLGLRFDACAAVRVRATDPQTQLSALERRKNLRAAFSINADVSGQCIAIFDDVMTTGATVSELSKQLLKSGAKQVQVWVIARAFYKKK